MHETLPGARVKGSVYLDGANIYGSDINPMVVRRRIGMVFQQPNPLRSRTIAQNVTIGLELEGAGRREREGALERALRRVGAVG